MKYIVQAKEDIDRHYGDVHLKAEAGEKTTLNAHQAEIALASGSFDFVREISESNTEKELLVERKNEEEERRAALLEKSHDELFDMAKSFENVKKSMTKTQLVDEILKPRAPVIVDAENTPDDGDAEINKGEI